MAAAGGGPWDPGGVALGISLVVCLLADWLPLLPTAPHPTPAQAKEIMYHKANLNRIMADYTVSRGFQQGVQLRAVASTCWAGLLTRP